MLILSRKRNEKIMVGDEIEFTIIDIRGDQVQVGIDAPRSIPVHRKEIYDIIQKEKAEKEDNQKENKDATD